MKVNLFLFSCLFLLVSPFMAVHAVEAEVSPEQPVLDQAEAKITSDATRSADSKSLFEGRCQMCHQLPEPSMLRPNQWRLILGTMQQRMQQAGVPPLTADETEMVLEHIAAQSR